MRPFGFLLAFQHFMVQQKFPFGVITVTVPAEVRSLLPKGCPISKPYDFLETSKYRVPRHFLNLWMAFQITDYSAIWYLHRLHLRRLIGVGQTNDSLSRLVGVSSMYSKKSFFSHFNSFSLFFHFRSDDIGNSIIYFISYKSLAIYAYVFLSLWREYGFHIVFAYGCFVFVQYCTARTEFNKTFILSHKKISTFLSCVLYGFWHFFLS